MIAVIDASVALKWQIADEEATVSALALLEAFIEGETELIAPTLFPYEIMSAINVAINRKRIKESDGYRAITYLISLGIEIRPFDDLVESTFTLARQYAVSPYDSAYLALAEYQKCNFYTGDKKLFKATHGDLSWVNWIGNYSR
jgi:predicted nucleic acid-binding protein